jgi:Zn-finger nucleic acid-binding protein
MFRFDAPDAIVARCPECGGVWLDDAGRARVLAAKLAPH